MAQEFTSAFGEALVEAPSMIGADWSTHGGRTKAIKRTARDRTGSVLNLTFGSLGYFMEGEKHERIFSCEWNQKDIVAVYGLGKVWAEACWQGRYRYDIVCELENRIAEFEVTMRGMFDVRARLSVGIFYGFSSDPEIGEGTWKKGSSRRYPLSSWTPPNGGTAEFPWGFSDGDEVLVLVMAEEQPELLSVLAWRSTDGAWVPTPAQQRPERPGGIEDVL